MRYKSKGNRYTITTFVAIAILYISVTAGAGVVPVNSNFKVLDGIEYYIQTDKAVYNLGENVEMRYRVTNLNNFNVTFTIPWASEWDFWIQKDGVDIWWQGHGWWQWSFSFILEPEQFIEYPYNFPYSWDMKDKENNLVGLGNYNVIGEVFLIPVIPENTKLSVPIQIVPEPSTLFLLGIGCLLLRHKK